VRAVGRSLAILAEFGRVDGVLSLEETSERVGLAKTTAHRLLQTLVAAGFVERIGDTGDYRLTLAVAELGAKAARSRSAPAVHDVLTRLRDRTQESIGFHTLHGTDAIVLDRVSSQQALRYDIKEGSVLPGSCTSAGNALLAQLSDDVVEELYRGRAMVVPSPRAPSTLDELKGSLERVRSQGYALDDEYFSSGLRCVAVPVIDRFGQRLYSLGLSGVSARLTVDDLRANAEVLADAAVEISRRLAEES
jgi:IclR family KDG regulon transcriptional repressor